MYIEKHFAVTINVGDIFRCIDGSMYAKVLDDFSEVDTSYPEIFVELFDVDIEGNIQIICDKVRLALGFRGEGIVVLSNDDEVTFLLDEGEDFLRYQINSARHSYSIPEMMEAMTI